MNRYTRTEPHELGQCLENGLFNGSLRITYNIEIVIDESLPSLISCQRNSVYRALRKHLLSFLVTLVKSLSRYTKAWRLDKERIFIGDLAYALALNLDLADNPQFYDLPVLETSLVCLAHITAQPHWSSYCKFSQGMSLCIQLMTSLVQVGFSLSALSCTHQKG